MDLRSFFHVSFLDHHLWIDHDGSSAVNPEHYEHYLQLPLLCKSCREMDELILLNMAGILILKRSI